MHARASAGTDEGNGSDGTGARTGATIFTFHPPSSLQLKASTGSRAATPRNLVVPETTEAPLPMAAPQAQRQQQQQPRHNASLSPSARKYLARDGPAAASPSSTRGSGGRTLRHSIRLLQRESVLLTQHVVRASRQIYRQLSLRQLLAYLLVLAGLVSECATPATRFNVPIGIVVFMSSPSFASTSGSSPVVLDHRVVVAGLALTTLVDFTWLLRPQDGSFNGYFRVQLENVTHVAVATCAMLKLWLVFATYFDLGPEIATEAPPKLADANETATTRFWARAKYAFPRKTLPRRSHLSYEVLLRILALIWLHGLGGAGLLGLGLYASAAYADRPHFRATPLGLPLHLVMLLKAATTLGTYVLATHHMSYHGCLTLAGCDRLAQWHAASASDVVLRYSRRWLARVQRAKALDALAGVYLLVVYYAAFRATALAARGGVAVVLGLTGGLLLLLDVWAPLLIMVVARCGAVLHAHHRQGTRDVDPYYPNQLEWEEDDDDDNADDDDDDDDEDDDDDDDDDEADDDPDDEGSSESSSDGRRRRNRRRHRRGGVSTATATATATGSRSSPRTPLLLKRQNSLLIVDSTELEGVGTPPEGRPYWVRHWDDGTERSYLVHSLTHERIWEMTPTRPKAPATTRPPRRDGPASGRSPRISGRRPSSSRPTSDSDVVLGAPTAAIESPIVGDDRDHRPSSRPLLGLGDFLLLWDALPDGGNFTCRVTRIPAPDELARHLERNRFVVAGDGLNVAHQRTIHFYAAVLAHEPSSSSSSASGVDFFLGEFVFDSLSLKLFARFRCPNVEAIVQFVRRLQLKEIVGAYAPCE